MAQQEAKREKPAKAKPAKAKPAPQEAAPRARQIPYAEAFEAALAGKLPSPPDFSAETHARYRGKLADLKAMVRAGDAKGLRAFAINPTSTSPKALERYRDLALVALKARAKAANGK